MTKKSSRRNRSKEQANSPVPPVAVPASALVTVGASFAGPIPSPILLKQYDDIVPGAADRIIEMAEKQAKHRMTLESKVIESDIRQSRAGLIAGLCFSLAALIGGIIVVLCGHPTPGTVIASIPTAGLVGVFVYGSSKRVREREEKAKLVTGQK